MLVLILAIGTINVYYFLDFVLQKENRFKLYYLWLFGLVSIGIHASFQVGQAAFGNLVSLQALEVVSLMCGSIVVLLLAKETLSYSIVDVKRRLEAAVQIRTSELEKTKEHGG